MTETSPTPARSKRMIVWLVAVPIVLALLALAGANWKVFHLVYCKRLLGSASFPKRREGQMGILRTHVRIGMPREDVRRLFLPLESRVSPGVLVVLDNEGSMKRELVFSFCEGRLHGLDEHWSDTQSGKLLYGQVWYDGEQFIVPD